MRITDRGSNAIEARAAAWLARCDTGMEPQERDEFDRWREADPRHEAAVNEISAVWAALDRQSATGQAELLREKLRALDRRDRRRWMNAGATALAAACLALGFVLWRAPVSDPDGLAGAVATARVSGPERQVLPDGSVVEFRPGAAITVDFRPDARIVTLRSGEAHFSVTKNPHRPFIVEAGTVKVRAVGTAFAVQLGGAEVEVFVTEGKVNVASFPAAMAQEPGATGDGAAPATGAEAPMPVGAGQQATVRLGPAASLPVVVSIPEVELAERLSWRVPALDFSETTIAEAMALFNRYGKVRLRTTDTVVGAMRVTGVFRSDNPEGFVRAVAASLGLRAEYRSGEILLHRS